MIRIGNFRIRAIGTNPANNHKQKMTKMLKTHGTQVAAFLGIDVEKKG